MYEDLTDDELVDRVFDALDEESSGRPLSELANRLKDAKALLREMYGDISNKDLLDRIDACLKDGET